MAENTASKIETKELSQVLRESSFIVPIEDTRLEENKIIADFSNSIKLDGFRKGKIPLDIVKGRFKKEIEDNLIEKVVNIEVEKYFKDSDVQPIASPALKKADYQLGGQLTFIIEYEVEPKFEVQGYDSLKLSPKKIKIKGEDIDAEIERLRFSAAESLPVEDRGIEKGDEVTLNGSYNFIDEPKHDHAHDIKNMKYLISTDKKDYSNFDDKLIGLKKGEEKTFEIKVDTNKLGKNLQDKNISFNLKVEDIRLIKLPTVNDDFARSLGDFENLDTLKSELEASLEHIKLREERSKTADEMFHQLREKNPFEVPRAMIEDEVKSMLYNAVMQSMNSGLQLPFDKIDWEKMREKVRPDAEKAVARGILLSKIAEKANITVSDTEVEEKIKKIAEENKQNVAKLREHLEKSGEIRAIKFDILFGKTVDFLFEINHIKIG
jgi:trigger factor